MADNTGTVLDQDGAASDWIEVYNPGSSTVNLAGWHLTDNAADLTQWTFPATNLPPGGFLLVFASGKNRAVAGQELHSNFQLNSVGEYLALVKPDGVTVVHEYAPLFPPQLPGVSYGVAVNVATTTFVTSGANARWRVPANSSGMPADWVTTNFNDSGWSSGATGIGFSGGTTNLYGPGPSTNVARGKPTTQSSTNSSFTPNLAVNGVYTDFSHTLAGVNLPATWEANLGTNYGIERLVIWNRTSCCQSRLRDITVRILNSAGTATNYTSAVLNPENVLGGGVINVGPTNLSLNLTQLTGGLVFGGRIRITRTPDPDLSGSGGQGAGGSEPDVLTMAEVEVFAVPATTTTNGAFGTLIQTDVASAMKNVNSTALIRIPFNIADEELPVLNTLTLRMKYDDGFVAYLNGVEVARRNAPVAPAWNSAATNSHPDAVAAQFESIDISPSIGLLQEGDNLLAIQGLNVATNDGDFLILSELSGDTITLTPNRYFAQPTPGTLNSGSALGVVDDPSFSVKRGFFDVPFTVALTSATAGAEIRYTTDNSLPSAVNGTIYTNPIAIEHSTVLRAVATKPGWLASPIKTHTYIFPANVMTQTVQSAVNAGLPAAWTGTTSDYDTDPNITGPYSTQMVASLRWLPSVFISATGSNLFDSVNGIYTHPTSHGIFWERAASMEMVGTNGQSEFQIDCGLRIQGGAFRSFDYTEKKSLRVLFKSIYGEGRLTHDLFKEPGAAQDFDGLVFRAGGNDGYAWAAAGTTVQFTRDEFGRGLLRDMGHPSARGMFVHLYLDGLYWGVYNLVERPNEDFCASYLGGEASDWDSITSKDNVKSGDFTMWLSLSNQVRTLTTFAQYQQIQGNNADGSRNPSYPLLYDKVDYMDYMLLNIWGGNYDWPNNNYWAGRKRTADSTGFKYFAWDYENTLGNNRARSPLDMVAPRAADAAKGVGVPHYFMKSFSEYQMDFADRVQRYFFNNGLLTPTSLTNRYRQLADSLEPAIIAEAARWGDDNHTPAYGLPEWFAERDWILTNYLPQRTAVVMAQLRGSNLYPAIGAPLFSQLGGSVPLGYELSLSHTNASGTVFYSLDGSDPRVPGTGAVGPNAQAYSTPVVINAPTLVHARVLSGAQWSAAVEAVFTPPQDLSKLALTEVMYHAPDVGATNGDEFDFIELKNTGTATLDLSGLSFTAGVTFTFTNGTFLGAGQFFVLARNAAAMAAKYQAVPVRGIFSGKLDNGGETITLSEPSGVAVFSVTYDDEAPWPVAADGFGFSLVQANPGVSQAPDKGERWHASAQPGGSPGADDPAVNIPGVVINEILTHTDFPQPDAIELYNPSPNAADISGWYLTDDPSVPKKYRIPNGTVLPPGGYVYYDETQFNPTPATTNNFALSSSGENVYLFSATTNGVLTGYSHGVVFGASLNGVSFGRYVNSADEESFPLQSFLTLGAPNSDPRVGPVVINEINYHPDTNGDEFVELLNITGSPVPLFDPLRPTNTWKVGGLGYSFPTNITLGAGQMLLVVATNPATFRAKYGVPAPVQIFGPFAGALQNNGENLELQAPDAPDTNGVPYVAFEQVRYNDKAPWPPGADGTGMSLQRLLPYAYGNEPAYWVAAAPTPGQPYGSGDTDGDGLPDAWETAHGTQVNIPDATSDPDNDGFSNWQEYLAGTDPQDPLSALAFQNVKALSNGVRLEFQAMANHSYTILCCPSAVGGSWTKLTDVSAGASNRTVAITNTSLNSTARFFRLVTPAQP